MYFPSMRLESDQRRKLFRTIVMYPSFNVESRKSLSESGLVIISAKPVLRRHSFESAFKICGGRLPLAACFWVFEKSFSNLTPIGPPPEKFRTASKHFKLNQHIYYEICQKHSHFGGIASRNLKSRTLILSKLFLNF